MEPESPSPYLQVPANCPFPEPTLSGPQEPPQVQGDQNSLCTWRLYCNHQVYKDFLIILYKRLNTKISDLFVTKPVRTRTSQLATPLL
jgi:hypothetical protein